MPKSKNRTPRRPKASAKSNSWFRMQASADNEAEIYIYDEIGYWGVTARQFVNDLKALGDVTHINLHINSPGGDVFDGIAIFNALKHHGAAITVHIDGLAASMASVIAMVGNPVIMPENTMMMIHKPWGFAGGDANDMRDYAELLDKVESVLIPAYAAKTGKSSDEIAAMLEDETWMDGSECVELGFADQVTPSLQAMACIQSKRIEDFEKMPNNIRNMITPPRNSNQRDPQQPVNQPQAQHAATQPNGADENTIRAQVIAEQKERVNGINNLFAMFGGKHSELQAQCVADMDCTVDQAKDKLLALLGKDASPSAKTTPAHIHAGNGNFVADGIRQALMARIQTLTQLAAQWLVYQGVQLLVGKTTQATATAPMIANAQATALQAQLAAYASTAAIPIVGPGLAPAALAAAAGVTTPLVAAISASALAGMAHDGIDKIPETGTWLLKKGERVTTAGTSAKLDATLDQVRQQRTASSRPVVAEFHNTFTGKPDDTTMQMVNQQMRASEKRLKQYFTSQVQNPSENYGRALKAVYPGRRMK